MTPGEHAALKQLNKTYMCPKSLMHQGWSQYRSVPGPLWICCDCYLSVFVDLLTVGAGMSRWVTFWPFRIPFILLDLFIFLFHFRLRIFTLSYLTVFCFVLVPESERTPALAYLETSLFPIFVSATEMTY